MKNKLVKGRNIEFNVKTSMIMIIGVALISVAFVVLLQELTLWLVGLLMLVVTLAVFRKDFPSLLVMYVALILLWPKIINVTIPGLTSTISPSRIFLVSMVIVRIIETVRGRRATGKTPLDKWIILVIVTTLLTIPFSSSFSVSLPRFIGQLLEYWLLFYFVVYNLHTMADVRRVLIGIIVIVGLATLMGVFELFVGANLYRDIIFSSRSHLWDWQSGSFVPGTNIARILGPFEHPIAFGLLLAITFPISLWLFRISRSIPRFLLLCLMGAEIVCIIFTLSRLSWIVIAVGLFVAYTSLSRKKMLVAVAYILLFSMIPIPAFLGAGQSSLGNILIKSLDVSSPGEGVNQSAVGRLMLVNNAVEVFQVRPLFGWGLSITKTLSDPNLPYLDEYRTILFGMENQYLAFLVDLGIVGAIPWFILLFAAVMLAWKVARTAKDAQYRLLTTALLGCVVSYCVSLLGVGGYFQSIDPLFWILMGIVVAINAIKDSRLACELV